MNRNRLLTTSVDTDFGSSPTIENSVQGFPQSLKEQNPGGNIIQTWSSTRTMNSSTSSALSLFKMGNDDDNNDAVESFQSCNTVSVFSTRKDHRRKDRHSVGGDVGRNISLNLLGPSRQEHRNSDPIDAKRIFVREERKRRSSTFRSTSCNTNKLWKLCAEKAEGQQQQQRPEQQQRNGFSVLSDDHDECTSTNNKKKRVRFTGVTIQEYPIIVGDNPGGSGGPPVSIDWRYINQVQIDIEKFETIRGKQRRSHYELKMDIIHRQNLLRRQGYSMKEQLLGTKIANIIRNQRRKSIAQIDQDKFHEHLEIIRKRFRTVLTLGFRT